MKVGWTFRTQPWLNCSSFRQNVRGNSKLSGIPMVLRCWKVGWQTVSISPSPFPTILSSSRLPLLLLAVVCGDGFKGIAPVSLPAFSRSLLLCHLWIFFCLFLLFCVTFMMQSVTHRYTVPTMMETLGKRWCHNVCIINKMMSSRTVPSWRKHWTVQPSRLNRPLPFLTTDLICFSTHAGLRPGACCMFFFFNRLFNTLIHNSPQD